MKKARGDKRVNWARNDDISDWITHDKNMNGRPQRCLREQSLN